MSALTVLRMRALWALVMLSSCVSCVLLPKHASTPVRSQASQSASSVELLVTCMTRDGELDGWRGSGVIISSRTVLTASHVVKCDTDPLVTGKLADGTGRAFLVEAQTPRSATDLARLRSLTELPYTAVSVGPPPGLGSTVCLDAAAPTRSRRCGPVVGNDGTWLRILAVPIPGNSGSGVYDARGRLVGIISHQLLDANTEKPVAGGAASLTDRWRWFARP